MKTASKLIIFNFTLLALTASAYAQSQSIQPFVVRGMSMEEAGDKKMAEGSYESALWHYSKWGAFSAGFGEDNPDTHAYRERLVGKMAAVIAKMAKPPVIPEYSEFHAQKGAALVKLAKTPADFAKAVKEFQDAVNQAPWVFNYHFNLAVAYKLAGQFKFALNSLNLARLLVPSDKDRRDMNGLRAEIEAAQEMSPK